MSQTTTKRPLTTLQKSTKKNIFVKLKKEVEYKGKMENVDSYMKLIMTESEEISKGKPVGKFGRVNVCGNNVIFKKLQKEI